SRSATVAISALIGDSSLTDSASGATLSCSMPLTLRASGARREQPRPAAPVLSGPPDPLGSGPTMSENSDLELLRRFEPVLKYTAGELFFPTDVRRYVESCSLWIEEDGKEREEIGRASCRERAES